MLQTEHDRLSNLSENLHKKIVEQDNAIDTVVKAILKRPIGVGKKELAKTLALEFFDSTQSIIYVDMSKYSEVDSIAQLIYAPSDYIDYGSLIAAVRRKSYALIILEDIEKAHRHMLHIFSQILTDGYFINENSQKVDFKNTIFIFTLKIDTPFIFEENENSLSTTENFDEASFQSIKDHMLKQVHSCLPSEFLNRLDGIAFFHTLNSNQLSSIVHLQLKSLEEHLKEQNITINWTDNVVQSIFKKSYKPAHGARPLREYFEKHIAAGLSNFLNDTKVEPNNHIAIDIDFDDQYKFHIQEPTSTS
ncbi:unnamed protein product [Rotaria sp. Silwood1]|nr:unnamed protein product [Rotaria sp. Silwood1]